MAHSEEHDDLLFAMLKECKSLPIFLNHIFGFLNRRTDFYHIATDEKSLVGLPPGLAEQTVKQIFYQWKPKKVSQSVSEVSKPKEVAPKPPPKPESDKFTKLDCYNGASFDNYSWSQSIMEIDIVVKLPDNTSSKDLDIKVETDRISVKLKKGAVLLEGELCEKCKHNEVLWSLQKNRLDIHLDKCVEKWWDCLLKSEPRLDVNTLDCSRPFDELPEEAQVKIAELQWNQERKRLGLPTSDEMAMHKILEKSWDAEGSPFSGPFDPNVVKFN